MIVLDCSTLLPGPFLGKLLLDQGATVYKIENPDRPDGARDMGSFYNYLNDGKELKWLNLKREDDRKKLYDLVKKANALIEGFRPEAKARLGITEDILLKHNPELCIASIVGYPEKGPWANRAGHDINFQAQSGALSLIQGMPGLPLADLFTVYRGAFQLMKAINDVEQGQPGRRVVISMYETMQEVQGIFVHEFHESQKEPQIGDTLTTGKFPCYNIYTTKDGVRVTVGAIEEKFWKQVCDILFLPEYVEHGYAEGDKGKETKELVQKAFESQPWSHWENRFEQANCCVEPVLNYSEAYPNTQ